MTPRLWAVTALALTIGTAAALSDRPVSIVLAAIVAAIAITLLCSDGGRP